MAMDSPNDHLGAGPRDLAEAMAKWNRQHSTARYAPACWICMDVKATDWQEAGTFFNPMLRQWEKCPNCYGKNTNQ